MGDIAKKRAEKEALPTPHEGPGMPTSHPLPLGWHPPSPPATNSPPAQMQIGEFCFSCPPKKGTLEGTVISCF